MKKKKKGVSLIKRLIIIAQSSIIKQKSLTISSIVSAHKNYVSDIAFIPSGVKVDRKITVEGKITHFLSVSEDGLLLIWDSRLVEKDNIRAHPEYIWKPYVSITLFR